jgi:hypothetical protein
MLTEHALDLADFETHDEGFDLLDEKFQLLRVLPGFESVRGLPFNIHI